MKQYILAAVLACCPTLLALPCEKVHPVPNNVPATLPGGWNYNWGDEFDGDKLDTSKWRYEEGIVRNLGSSQIYSKDAVAVKQGKLIITTSHGKYPNPAYEKDSKRWNDKIPFQQYMSGSVTTKELKHFYYGRLEIRAKLPNATGAWPALWTLGANKSRWPACGEMDIMEHLSQHPGLIYSTFHWGDKKSAKTISKGFTHWIQRPYDKFATYVLEWDKEKIRVYLNDVQVAVFNSKLALQEDGSNPFHIPHYLIMNTAIGGPGTWPEQPDAKDYPAQFEIDYVRFYTRDEKESAEKRDEKIQQLTY